MSEASGKTLALVIFIIAVVAFGAGFGVGYVFAPGKIKIIEKEVPVVKTEYVYKTIEPNLVVMYKGARKIKNPYPYCTINPALYEDVYLSALILAAKYETDPIIREKIYNTIQKLSNELVPIIWIGQLIRVQPVWNWVYNFTYHPLLIYAFKYVSKDPNAPNPDTFILLHDAEPRSLDPAVSYEGPGWLNMHQIYETLVTYPINSTEYVIPCLAVAWAYSPDGKEWYFVIRGNVVFYDPWENKTYPLTPEDVVFSLERVVTMGFGPSWIIGQFLDKAVVISEEEFNKTLSKGLKTYFKDKTATVYSIKELLDFFGYDGPIAGYVKLVLKKPYGAVLACLASTPGSIVCKEYVMKHGGVKAGEENKWMYDHPCGTGPYYLKEWVHGQYLVLEANPYYWGEPKPKLKRIIYKIVPDINTRIMILKKGDADTGYISPSFLGKLKGVTLEYKGKKWKLEIVSTGLSFIIEYIVPNTKKKPFDNVYVRKALAYAIPYKQIFEKVYNGTLKPLYGVIPKGMFGYTEEGLTKYTFNLTKAKELLAKAGYPKGLGGIKIKMLVVEGVKEWEMIATILKEVWKELGIDLEIEVLSWPTVDKKIESGDFDIYIMGWGPDFIDPDDYAYPLLHGGYEFDDVKAALVTQSYSVNTTVGLVYVCGG